MLTEDRNGYSENKTCLSVFTQECYWVENVVPVYKNLLYRYTDSTS